MAGATNRALKAAGLPKATIATIRVQGSRGVSLHSAIKIATKAGAHVPEKAHAHLARRTEAHAKLVEAFKTEIAKPNASEKRLDSLSRRIEAGASVKLAKNDKRPAPAAAPKQEAPKVAPKAPQVAANATAGERAVASAKHAVAVARAAAEGKDKYHPAVAKLNKAEKALRAAYEQQDAEPSRSNPATERMRASKANVATLRAQRDARRENMKRMRKRVDFARETKQLRAAFTPEHQRAIDKAEMGEGPNAALKNARQTQKRAMMEAQAARSSLRQAKEAIRGGHEAATQYVSTWKRGRGETGEHPGTAGEHARRILQDGPRARAHLAGIARRLEDAQRFRGYASGDRKHASLVKEGYALRDMAETRSPYERKRIKKETGYDGPSAPKGARAAARSNPFNMAKHLTKRIALTEKLASKLLNFTSVADTLKTKERFKKSQSALLRLTASRKQ